MKAKTRKRTDCPETEYRGEFQQFSGPALAPDDPTLEPRLRKGRPKRTFYAEKNKEAGKKTNRKN